jgi:hypothetical protein
VEIRQEARALRLEVTAVPLIPISERAVVMPLIGAVDAARAHILAISGQTAAARVERRFSLVTQLLLALQKLIFSRDVLKEALGVAALGQAQPGLDVAGQLCAQACPRFAA